ncbi:hypothetical protein LIER_08119 [Lithospermum erythrorhizon]|uniref:Late embryogenesis abundant protein LEA-2 subgroup domain-containing protein n=1 Tax=Lithospermum erythrorhizon TaxID=34254 RepID=A0AAV3PCE9_LITER
MNQSTTAPNELERQSAPEGLGHPPRTQPEPMTPPPGYAPPPYHQGYPMQPPYPGYPDPSYHHQSMPPQNGAYYTASQYPQAYPEPRSRYSLARGILCLITMLVIFTTSMSILVWAIYGANIPFFLVESMSVPTFEFKNSTLNAIWEANVTVHNPNKRMKVSFEHIEGRLFYKDILIDVSMVEAIWNLNSQQDRIMTAKFAVPNSGYDSTGAFWYQQIDEDRKKGSIWFNLRFVTMASFNADDFWGRRSPLAIICDNIHVQFPDATGGGKWNGSKQSCFITG